MAYIQYKRMPCGYPWNSKCFPNQADQPACLLACLHGCWRENGDKGLKGTISTPLAVLPDYPRSTRDELNGPHVQCVTTYKFRRCD